MIKSIKESKKMKIELEVPDSTVKKIKAWTLLKDDGDGDHNAAIAKIFDEALSKEIVRCLGIVTDPVTQFVPYMSVGGQRAKPTSETMTVTDPVDNHPLLGRPEGLMAYDSSSISLGDEDDEDGHDAGEAAEGEEAFVPSQGGLSEEALERDMYLEDPEHEAVAEGARDNPRSSPEDLFSSHLNLPRFPIVDPGVERRENLKRKTKGHRRAKVSNYGGPG